MSLVKAVTEKVLRESVLLFEPRDLDDSRQSLRMRSCNPRDSLSVSDVTASHAEDLAGFRFAALLFQGREEQGIHCQGCCVAAVGRSEVNDGYILARLGSGSQ